MTVAALPTDRHASRGLSARLLSSGLLYGGLAALAAGTPGPLSSPVLWVCSVLALLSTGHVAAVLVRGLMGEPGRVQAPPVAHPAPARPAPGATWTVPSGWQTGIHAGHTVLTRPDGRTFLVTDRAMTGVRNMTVIWWQPGSAAAPRWTSGVWQVGGTQADAVALAGAL